MFAVPAQTALHVGRDLVEHGRVTLVTLGADVGDGAGHGVRVASLTEGGPAAAAGVDVEDHLSAIDGCPTPDADRLAGCLMRYRDRSVVTLTLRRGGSPLTLEATLRDLAGV
jgi:putative serine protease PepD